MARQNIDQGAAVKKRVLWVRSLVWLAVVGVFPLSLAQWGPWVIEQVAIRLPGDTTATQVQQSFPGYTGLPGFLFAHGLSNPTLRLGMLWFGLAFASAGIFPALALVLGRGSAWAMRAYLAWLAAVTSLAAIAAIQLFGVTPRAICYGPGGCPTITLVSTQPGWGAWLTLGALALLWVAAGARFFTPRAAFAPYGLTQAPERVGSAHDLKALRRASAATFTLGALIWGFGLILVPWATNHCTGFPISWTHFVRGSCVGLDANDAIPFVWPTTTMEQALDFTMFLVFMGLLGIVAMGALWRKGWGGPVVAAIWAALATWLFLQVRAGLATMLEHPTRLTLATSSAWVSGAGPLVTGVGLALAFIGAIGAWIAAIDSFRRKGHASDLAPLLEATTVGIE